MQLNNTFNLSDCGDSVELHNGTKITIDYKTLTNGTKIESYVRYECNPGYLLDYEHYASGYSAHLHLFCMHGMEGELPNWNQTTLPQCLIGKTNKTTIIMRLVQFYCLRTKVVNYVLYN